MSDKVYKLADDLIAVIRELVQLSIITGTNVVDHLRNVQVRTVALENGLEVVVPTDDYIKAYNEYIEHLNNEALKKQQEAQEKEADDQSVH